MAEVNPADKIVDANKTKVSTAGLTYPQVFGDLDIEKINSSLLPCDKKDKEEYFTVSQEIENGPIKIEKAQGTEAQPTNQNAIFVLANTSIPAPVDVCAARQLKDISSHHASCVQSKKYSIAGLGFVSDAEEVESSKVAKAVKKLVDGFKGVSQKLKKEMQTKAKERVAKADSVQETENRIQSLLTGEAFIESKVDKVLDPLTLNGFMFDFYRVIEDFLDAGTGYIEVIRDLEDKIIGINWMPYEDINVVQVRDKNGKSRIVYKYRSPLFGFGGLTGSSATGGNRWFSMFGKENRDWVWDTYYGGGEGLKILNDSGEATNADTTNPNTTQGFDKRVVSEIIPIMSPSNRSRFYGYPEWLSASSLVTLVSMAMQYKSDFYTNKGVLAYILSVIGPVDSDKWKEIERLIQGSVGMGNNFKNLAINLTGEKNKVQIDKMTGSEKTELQFAKDMEIFAQNIVSAHRVPPVLANILIPGKLGATNEAVQALVSFQLLVIGPMQTIIQKTLARTLGGEQGIPELKPEDFRLRTITSQFDIPGLDTIGRAREEAVTADRDFSDGVKD